jgi:EAL and modified HD-GYP domain-containing signal transduction protein
MKKRRQCTRLLDEMEPFYPFRINMRERGKRFGLHGRLAFIGVSFHNRKTSVDTGCDMFGFLRGLFGQPGQASADAPDSRAPDISAEEGERHETHADGQHASAFICREALLGRDQKIIGYEFSHPRELQSRITEKRVLVQQFYDDVLLSHLTALELDSFLGERFAFLEISPASLGHPALLRLPRENVAIILNVAETVETINASEVAALLALRAHGMRVGLKWRRQWQDREEAWLKRLPGIDFIQMNWPDYTDDAKGEFLAWQIAAFRRVARAVAHPLRLIVCHLQTPDDFRLCYRLGFDVFHGPFINRREPGKVTKNAVNRLLVMELLHDLRHASDNRRLTQALRQDPVLSYRLLRYANAPSLGMTREITALDQAITILGRDNLYRWLSLLLFHTTDPGYYEWALTEQALARAALMERLGKRTGILEKESGLADRLFLTGLFSLLDRLMGEPLTELAAKIQVAEDVRAALLQRKGVLAQYLMLAESCEQQSPEAIARYAEPLGLSARQVSLATFDALAWAHAMAALGNN